MTDAALPPRPLGPHPTPEQLYKARRGPRNAEDERWLAHAAVCAACSEELLRQEAFDDPEPVSSGRLDAAWERFREPAAPKAPVIPITRNLPIAQPAARDRRPALRRAGLSLAAALVVATVGLGVWQRSHPLSRNAMEVQRGGTEPAGDWKPAGVLDAAPTEFVFPAPLDGEPQRVHVHNGPSSYSWTSPPSTDGRVPFPETERKKLKRGEDYYWTVVEEDGATAPTFRLR
jgi:hypothetical protein